MKKNRKHAIGDVIYFNQEGCGRAIRQLNEALPLINDFAEAYSECRIGNLTQEVFLNVIEKGIGDIMKKFENDSEDVEKIKQLPSILKNLLPDALSQIENKLRLKRDAIKKREFGIATRSLREEFLWDDYQIVDGKASILVEQIQERYTQRITNRAQLELIEEMYSTKEHWDKVVAMADANGYKTRFWSMYGNNSFFMENPDDRKLMLDLRSISWIKS